MRTRTAVCSREATAAFKDNVLLLFCRNEGHLQGLYVPLKSVLQKKYGHKWSNTKAQGRRDYWYVLSCNNTHTHTHNEKLNQKTLRPPQNPKTPQ